MRAGIGRERDDEQTCPRVSPRARAVPSTCPSPMQARPRARGYRVNRNDCVRDGDGRTWLGEVGDDADGVGNALEARVRGAAALLLGRRRRSLVRHRHGVVAAAGLVVLLLPHLTRPADPNSPASPPRQEDHHRLVLVGSSPSWLPPRGLTFTWTWLLAPSILSSSLSSCRFERQLGAPINKRGEARTR